MRSPEPALIDGLMAGGAPRMWATIVRDALPAMRQALPPGSRVLEIGYGDGLLSCWLASELGWRMTGLDVDRASHERAQAHARRYGLADRLDFRVGLPSETRQHRGEYDGVFMKTVLYSLPGLTEYRAWLGWLAEMVPSSGAIVNFETGRASALVQAYRRLRRRPYTGLSLYTETVERLYRERFAIDFIRYYGGLSQFLAPMPGVYEAAAAIESGLSRRTANNCFAVGMVLKRLAESGI